MDKHATRTLKQYRKLQSLLLLVNQLESVLWNFVGIERKVLCGRVSGVAKERLPWRKLWNLY